MKKSQFFSLFLLCSFFFGAAFTAAAQKSAADIFNAKTNVTWMGVDFTQATVLGETGTVSAVEMIGLFAKINDLIVNESEKYNFREALNRTDVPYDLGSVTEANAGIDPDQILSTSSADKSRFSEEKIAGLVKKYKSKSEGIGLVFFVESLSKPTETGTMWVTFFDLANGKVLMFERMTGKAMGFGFRNHWARPVYEVLKEIKKSKYKAWKSKFATK